MLNVVKLVGRINKEVPKETIKKGNKEYLKISIGITRPYKNENGEYQTDSIDVILTNHLATQGKEFLYKGCLIAIKGRLVKNEELNIEADRITYLEQKINK